MAVFGLEPSGYHLHNLLLYGLCCLATWLCCNAVLDLMQSPEADTSRPDRKSWACALATEFFALHHAHVESAAWVSGRKELLSGLFALLSLWQFGLALGPARLNRLRLGASCALYLAALMSKTTAVPTAAVALLLAGVQSRAQGRALAASLGRSLLLVAPMALVGAAWLAKARSPIWRWSCSCWTRRRPASER